MTTIKLPNGLEISGTPDQVKQTLKTLGYDFKGDSTYYLSKSRGLVKISEMQTTHLRNAILRIYVEWVNSLHFEKNPQKLVDKLIDGINDPTWLAMIREYRTRKEV